MGFFTSFIARFELTSHHTSIVAWIKNPSEWVLIASFIAWFELTSHHTSIATWIKNPSVWVNLIQFEIEYILIDLKYRSSWWNHQNYKFPFQSKRYDEKTAENCRNCYVGEKSIVSKLWNISIPNFDSINWRLEWRLLQNFTSLSFKPSGAGSGGAGSSI